VKKRVQLLAIFYIFPVLAFADPMEVRRFGLFIGANDGGQERQILLYADDDARAMARTMNDIGGISPTDSILLLDPTPEDVRTGLDYLSDQIGRVDNLVRRTEIMFYYSGHSDEQGILVADEQIQYSEIRNHLDETGADVVIAVLDSCSSGAFTRSKGGQRRSPFLIDESSAMEGHAFLTSSSETELSQESDRIGASFFTHYLITGLRGAADNTGDGRVTLNEINQHTYDETLSRTESTIGGPQHPSYEIQLTGTGDLVLTDLTVPTSALQLSGELTGRFSIRDQRERLVAEFTKDGVDTLKLALPSGSYVIRYTEEYSTGSDLEQVMTARVDLNRNAQLYLTMRDFTASGTETTRYRGDREEEEKEDKFVLSFVPGLNLPKLEENDRVVIQAGLIGAKAPELSGIQVAWLFGLTGPESRGLQASYLFNIADDYYGGGQVSGLFNIAGDNFNGIQASGLFNIAGRPSSGLQAGGLFNIAGELKGVQAGGIFNYSSYVEGAQMSLLNVAGTVKGVQIGLLNISREIYGVPIGFINLSRNGIVDLSTWYEYSGSYRLYTGFQSGSKYFYTLYYVGNSTSDFFTAADNLVWGFHIGGRLTLGFLEVDLDGGIKQSHRDMMNNEYCPVVPSFRGLVALKGLGLFWGVTMDLEYPGAAPSSLYTGDWFALNGDQSWRSYYRFIVGFRI